MQKTIVCPKCLSEYDNQPEFCKRCHFYFSLVSNQLADASEGLRSLREDEERTAIARKVGRDRIFVAALYLTVWSGVSLLGYTNGHLPSSEPISSSVLGLCVWGFWAISKRRETMALLWASVALLAHPAIGWDWSGGASWRRLLYGISVFAAATLLSSAWKISRSGR